MSPLKTIEKAISLLTSNGITPSTELPSLTVKDIVTNVLGFAYTFHAKDYCRLKECIPFCITSIRTVHTAWIENHIPILPLRPVPQPNVCSTTS